MPGCCGPMFRKMKSLSSLAALQAPFLGAKTQARFLFLGFFLRELERAHFRGARWVVLAQRVALPAAAA